MQRSGSILILLVLTLSIRAQVSFFPLGTGVCCVGAPELYGSSTNNMLYLGGGAITCVGNVPVQGMAQWDGVAWDSMGHGIGPRDIIEYNGELLVGGSYQSSSGNGTSRWNGSSWVPYVEATPANVDGFYVYNNELYVYGGFDSIAGIAANMIAKFDGATWTSFPALDTSPGGQIFDIEFFNGEMYVGGNFVYPAQTSRGDIAKWNGTTWEQVGNGLTGSLASVGALQIYNGELWVGGGFETSWGNDGNYLMKWDGSNWLQLSDEPNGFVKDLIVYGGKIYAGGYFNNVGTIANSAWSVRYAGNLCESYGLFDNQVTSFAELNSELYIGGGFWTIDGDSISKVARYAGALNVFGAVASNNILVFPNPSDGKINIQMAGPGSVEIINALGETVEICSSIFGVIYFDLSDKPKGIYLVRMRTRGEDIFEEFILY